MFATLLSQHFFNQCLQNLIRNPKRMTSKLSYYVGSIFNPPSVGKSNPSKTSKRHKHVVCVQNEASRFRIQNGQKTKKKKKMWRSLYSPLSSSVTLHRDANKHENQKPLCGQTPTTRKYPATFCLPPTAQSRSHGAVK